MQHRQGHVLKAGKLLADHQRARHLRLDCFIETLEKVDGFEVLPSALDIGSPFPGLLAIVQIEHRGDIVEPQAVHVVLLQPVEGIGDQELPYLLPSVVKDTGIPLAVLPLHGVAVFIAAAAVQIDQAIAVLGEVGNIPVHEHTDAQLMAPVHQLPESVGIAVPEGGREIIGGAVTPGPIKAVFHQWGQFQIVVAHFVDIIRQGISQFRIGAEPSVLMAAPGPRMHLIDIDGPPVTKALPLGHPAVITPGIESFWGCGEVRTP